MDVMAFYRTTMDNLMFLSFKSLKILQYWYWYCLSIFLRDKSLFHHRKPSILNLIRSTHIFAAVVQVGMLQHRYSVGRGAIARMQDVFLLQNWKSFMKIQRTTVNMEQQPLSIWQTSINIILSCVCFFQKSITSLVADFVILRPGKDNRSCMFFAMYIFVWSTCVGKCNSFAAKRWAKK